MRKVTGKARVERIQRLSKMLNLRMQGKTLQEIADLQEPKITFQAVSLAIKTALKDVVIESISEIRALELHRLDALLAAVWTGAMAGDIACVDRALAVMTRRARLLGLDRQPYFGREDGETDPTTVRVKVVGSPLPERMKFLEQERERLLGLIPNGSPTIN